jgi:hypothetical protein
MTTIDVRSEPNADGWTCTVRLADERSSTNHRVAVTRRDLGRLAPGADGPDDLVRRSFEFLLEREPKESVLPEFDLPVIGRYFPDYEATIRGRADSGTV